MGTAIQKVEKAGTLTLKTERAADMRLVLQEEMEVRALVREYIKTQMVQPVDYGPMPGVVAKKRADGTEEKPKDVLFKPGAEKLFDIFRCKPVYRILNATRDPASGLYSYEIRCRAVNRETGTVINEGLGSASSYESRYRYRQGDRLCPNCKKPTIIKGKQEYGGGWICFAKKGGCGAKWGDGAKEIESQEVGKIQNPDLADVANTVLKIAKKRAQVDCAIGLARVSDLFTADLEDLPTLTVDYHAAPAAQPPPSQPKPALRAEPVVEREPDLVEQDETRRRAHAIANAAEVLGGTVAHTDAQSKRSKAIWVHAKTFMTPQQFGELVVKTLGSKIPSNEWTDAQMDSLESEVSAREDIPF